MRREMEKKNNEGGRKTFFRSSKCFKNICTLLTLTVAAPCVDCERPAFFKTGVKNF